MATQILEGTWEEIAAHADELAGKRLRVIVEQDTRSMADSDDPPLSNLVTDIPVVGPPNLKALAVLAEIAERQKGRRETSGEDTLRIIREGRSGGMYGMEPIND